MFRCRPSAIAPTRSAWPVLLLGLALSLPAASPAVVVRADRDDAVTLQLGQRFPAVGRVLPDGGATLIAPTWALTAAHVAADLRPGDAIEFADQRYAVLRVVLHPDGQAPRGQPPDVDLALVQLATPVLGVEPVALYRRDQELGQTAYLVGCGDFGPAGGPLTRTDGRRRAVTNRVDDAGPRRLFFGFDTPPAGSEVEGVGGPGDSGGAALLDEGGRLYLIGVSSASMGGKPGQYGVTDVHTRVSAYANWIDATVAAP